MSGILKFSTWLFIVCNILLYSTLQIKKCVFVINAVFFNMLIIFLLKKNYPESGKIFADHLHLCPELNKIIES